MTMKKQKALFKSLRHRNKLSVAANFGMWNCLFENKRKSIQMPSILLGGCAVTSFKVI